MIVDRIYQYLNAEGKTMNPGLLYEATDLFQRMLSRQLMRHTERLPGFHVTHFTHPCARKGAYDFHGFQSEPLSSRAKLNFIAGDIVELTVLVAAKLAGCDIIIKPPPASLRIAGTAVVATPDAFLQENGEIAVVEVKKMTSYAFRRFRKNGLDDTWGYLSQVECYLKAMNLDSALAVAMVPETGELHEQRIFFNEFIWIVAEERAKAILNSTPKNLPPRAFAPDGKGKLELRCSYCGHRQTCWPGAEMVMVRGKPAWYVKEEE